MEIENKNIENIEEENEEFEEEEKDFVLYTKERLVNNIARACEKELNDELYDRYGLELFKKDIVRVVRIIYNTLEANVFRALSSSDSSKDVTVRVFKGISFNSEFVPEHYKLNNLTGEHTISSSRVKITPNITRAYKDKINTYKRHYS